MNKDIIIVLPSIIPVLRDGIEEQLKRNIQEFNIYFKNIIYPYKEEYDVQVRCSYGNNYGTFWRLCEYPRDVDSFKLEIVIFNEYGERIASKETEIVLYDRKEDDERFNMIFVGDSMTFAQTYMEQIASNLHNVAFKGSRNVFGHISHEGRGGWSYSGYFTKYKDDFGVSPFLFPKGVDNYVGDVDFINNVNDVHHTEYIYTGFEKHRFREGMIYGKEDKLYTYENGEFKIYDESPEWEFDFEKYIKRYNIGEVDAVSVLMGANDLQIVYYEESDKKISEYINNTEKLINAIHKYDENIDIIINLPIIGAEQYAWGKRLGCIGSSKMYKFNIIRACNAILNKWGNSSEKHVYIGPMLLCIDPDNGFLKESIKVNRYSESLELHQSNWVHPNEVGYRQMGDAICGTIQKLRGKR